MKTLSRTGASIFAAAACLLTSPGLSVAHASAQGDVITTGTLTASGTRIYSPYEPKSKAFPPYPYLDLIQPPPPPPPPYRIKDIYTQKIFYLPDSAPAFFRYGSRYSLAAPPFFDEETRPVQFQDLGVMYARYVPRAISPPLQQSMGDMDETASTYDPGASPEFLFTVGWQSADIYEDIDKTSEAGFPLSGDPTGDKVERTSIYYTKASAAYKGFAFTATYLDSVESLEPREATGEALLRGLPAPVKRRYEEMDLSLNYSHEIVPRLFDATIGYTAYFDTDDSFWGTGYSGEFYSELAFKGIPHLRPNATFSLFNSAVAQLRGKFFNFCLDSYGLTIFRSDRFRFAAELNPYVAIGLDDGLVDDGPDWSAFRFGLRMPLHFGSHVVVNLDINDAVPINGHSDSTHNFRTDLGEVGPWGGVSVSLRF